MGHIVLCNRWWLFVDRTQELYSSVMLTLCWCPFVSAACFSYLLMFLPAPAASMALQVAPAVATREHRPKAATRVQPLQQTASHAMQARVQLAMHLPSPQDWTVKCRRSVQVCMPAYAEPLLCWCACPTLMLHSLFFGEHRLLQVPRHVAALCGRLCKATARKCQQAWPAAV